MTENKQNQDNNTIELVDLNVLKGSVDHTRTLVDNSFKEGKYGIEEAQNIIISFNYINRALDTLRKLQLIALKLKENQQEAEKTGKAE